MGDQDPPIHHDQDVHRFATTVDGERAYIDYRLEGGVMTLTHTWVPDAIGGSWSPMQVSWRPALASSGTPAWWWWKWK